MTGREFIVYIIANHLEDENIFGEEILSCFMDEYQAASKFDVGVETIKLWYKLGLLPGIKAGDSLFFFNEAKDPRRKNDNDQKT